MKSKILLALAGVLTLFSVYCEAELLFSREELKAKEVNEPCWDVVGAPTWATFSSCASSYASICEINLNKLFLDEYELSIKFDSKLYNARADLIEGAKKYGIVFDEDKTDKLCILVEPGQIKIILTLLNEIEPLSNKVIGKVASILGNWYTLKL